MPEFQDLKEHEDIFYLWRSASDVYNELGWRFLNFIRIIERITKKQRGKGKKAREMYDALPLKAKKAMSKSEI